MSGADRHLRQDYDIRAKTKMAVGTVSVLWKSLIILHVYGLLVCQGEPPKYVTLYRRISNVYLKTIPVKVVANVTVNECARYCATEVEFECKSFDIDNLNIECHLHNHTHLEPLLGIQHARGFDHYRTNYERLFNRIPNHVITMRHNRNIRGLTVEECARRCVLEMNFRCQGFDYETRQRNCWLSDKVAHDVNGLQRRAGIDFYERKTNGALSRFINYGLGSLRPLEGVHIHGKIVLGVNLDACAQLCLAETSFPCASFDYVFNEMSCQLSQYIAANVHGLLTEFDHSQRVMHYELIGEYLAYFYPTPYAAILEHNDRTLRHVTPEGCARKCLEEKEFVCRSFDYQIRKGTCLLSHMTGSDAGSLYTPEEVDGVHHFELKPSLDCGGISEGEKGTFASPNWPRHYHHHLNCTWEITVPEYKIIHIQIYHLDLGEQSHEPCNKRNDVLSVTEVTGANHSTQCLHNSQTELSTVTNKASVRFKTNAENDAQGFRIFYNAEWPCNITLSRNHGQFASPRWPSDYPAGSRCVWTIEAPPGASVILKLTSVQLEDHIGSRCNTAFDKIDVYDGEMTSSDHMKTLCGDSGDEIMTSSGNIMTVTFVSDSRVQARGFHSSYSFINMPTTTSLVTTSTQIKPVTSTVSTIGGIKMSATTSLLPTNTTTWQSDVTTDDVTTNSTRHLENNATGIVQTMKMVGKSTSEDKREVVELTAIFIESSPDKAAGDDNKTSGTKDLPGDNVERGTNPDVKYDSDEDVTHRKTGSDVFSIIIGIILGFMCITFLMSMAIALVCRYYRRRLPKLRHGSNLGTGEENVSLCHRSGHEERYKDEADIAEAARLPLPEDHDPIPDVEFLNPLYVGARRKTGTNSQQNSSRASVRSTRSEEHQNDVTSCPSVNLNIEGNSMNMERQSMDTRTQTELPFMDDNEIPDDIINVTVVSERQSANGNDVSSDSESRSSSESGQGTMDIHIELSTTV